MELGQEIYSLAEEVNALEAKTDLVKKLQAKVLDIYIFYNRHKNHKMQRYALTDAILFADDTRCLLKLCVQLKHIEYDQYKKWDEEAHKLVKRMITEKNITFGSNKR